MEGENEESCGEWMSQTGSIRGLTADGKSHHWATQVELIEFVGGLEVPGRGDGERKIKMGSSWGSSVKLSSA